MQAKANFISSHSDTGRRNEVETSRLSPGSETFSGSSNMPMPTSSSSGYNANNQIESSSLQMGGSGGAPIYDAAGDVLQDNQNKYLYDPNGRVCATQNLLTGTMTGYLYDAEGVRVAKGNISNLSSCDPAVNGFQLTQAYVIGQSKEQISEYDVDDDGSVDWQHTNVWMGGTLLATYLVAGPPLSNSNDPGNPFPNSTLHFYFNDPLGTRRAQTDYTGTVEQTCASLPFGNGETCIPLPTEHLFTGKERDAESGNDYFLARYFGSTMGRFLTTDDGSDQDPEDPQSWDLYSYVRNNPLINTDPNGHGCDTVTATYSVTLEGQTFGDSQPSAPDQTCDFSSPFWDLAFRRGVNSQLPRSWTNPFRRTSSPSEAPNNTPTVSHCLGAAASAKGVSIGLDILGAIPAVGNAVSASAGIVRAGIAVNHAITSPAFAVGSGLYGAYGGITAGPGEATDSLVGSASAGAGIGLALADASLEGTKAIPIVGNFVSVATLGWDGYQAYKAYQSCMAGH
jgi:RHS repeat-associated protein